MAACTVTVTASGATCGAPAVLTFGAFAECAAHARPLSAPPVPPRSAAVLVRCRREACVDHHGGPHYTVEHRR